MIDKEYLNKPPQMAELLKPLAALLDNQTMIDQDARIDGDHESPTVVAADFLRSHPINPSAESVPIKQAPVEKQEEKL